MSKAYRFPVLHWRDRSGQWTSILLEDLYDATAYSANPTEGERQLKAYLQRLGRDDSHLDEPTFVQPELRELKVSVRPEFEQRERPLPCTYVVNLFLPMVVGIDCGLHVCVLPTLDLRFYYHPQDTNALHDLAVHYVRRRLGASPPADIARFSPPEEVRLSEFVMRLKLRRRRGPALSHTHLHEMLSEVAEPVLHSRAVRLPTAWEREEVVSALKGRLAELKGGLLIIGEAGCGKSTVIAEAMRREARERGVATGKGINTDYWLSSAPRLIAGMRYLGQWQERCEQVIADLDSVGGILWFENLLDLVKTGGQGPRDSIANFLHPYLVHNELKLVVEATPAELETAGRLLPGFAESFERVVLPSMEETASIRLLDSLVGQLRQRHALAEAPGVAATTHQLFHRFLPYAAFPGQAARFLTTLFAHAHDVGLDAVDSQEVLNEFIRTSGLPRTLVDDRIRLDYEERFAHFQGRIIGQDAACAAAAQLLTTFKAGLHDPQRPIGVLLFCGPTGVGKTEMSKQIAKAFFGAAAGETADRLLRLDMSEYTGYGAAERLLRKPDGTPSEFVQKMRRQAFRLVLLDEIEKADPEVFDLFLRVFDEGILHDTEGRPTNFRSSVIIMTSNLGASATDPVGFAGGAPGFEAAAKGFFRPEFFNRMDAVITFNPLGLTEVREIARLELQRLTEREGLAERGLRLTWDETLPDWLAENGSDRRFGARPLQRFIEEHVMTPLARSLAEIPEARDMHLHLRFTGNAVDVNLV